jgi:hypothetical protein
VGVFEDLNSRTFSITNASCFDFFSCFEDVTIKTFSITISGKKERKRDTSVFCAHNITENKFELEHCKNTNETNKTMWMAKLQAALMMVVNHRSHVRHGNLQQHASEVIMPSPEPTTVYFGSGCFWERQYAYAWEVPKGGS